MDTGIFLIFIVYTPVIFFFLFLFLIKKEGIVLGSFIKNKIHLSLCYNRSNYFCNFFTVEIEWDVYSVMYNM